MGSEKMIPSLAVNLFPFHLESEEDQSPVGSLMVPNSKLMLVADF